MTCDRWRIPALAPGQVLVDRDGHELTIRSLLGKGGLGLVYEAVCADRGRLAVKIPRKITSFADVVAELRYVSGVRAAHAAIPVSVGTGMIPEYPGLDIPFLVMPLYEMGSIHDRFPEATRVPVGLAARWVVQISRALAKLQIVHRDIKPENIFLDSQQNAYIGDFGLAIPESDQRRAACEVVIAPHPCGTLDFMSPEQFACDTQIDRRSDIYAIGMVLFELVTGTVARDAVMTNDMDHYCETLVRMDWRVPLERVRDIRVRSIIARCTAVRLADRYRDHHDLVADILPLADLPTKLDARTRETVMRTLATATRR